MGLLALFMGVFGSVFNTYASLYQAKDNDLLLSMPIPSGKILLVRLSGVYAMGLMYEVSVMIPTLVVWFMTAPVTALCSFPWCCRWWCWCSPPCWAGWWPSSAEG